MNPPERSAMNRRPIWRQWPIWVACPIAAVLMIVGYDYLSEEPGDGPMSVSSKGYEIPPPAELTPDQIEQYVHSDPSRYTEDQFFGIRWRWEWHTPPGGGPHMVNLGFICPQCDSKSPLYLDFIMTGEPGVKELIDSASPDPNQRPAAPRCRWCGERLIMHDDWPRVVAAVGEQITMKVAVGEWKD